MSLSITTLPEMYAGTNMSYDLAFTLDDNVTPVNLTGCHIEFRAKNEVTDPDTSYYLLKTTSNGGISFVSLAGGTARMDLIPADTGSLTTSIDLVFAVKLFLADTTEQITAIGILPVTLTAIRALTFP